ncbi:MAG: isoleucine--tRNA ligase [Candidatus Zambryskibacteria bacterium CG11_big_fil_rev_8_21_14_0_20_42_18]|uniref:Isoleucine--tRNA ligase n=1 Tax=Candidatus Zambryskibacteria bacterium CG_4_9_14_3_um_filter_42_15 TaxID=1975112 RepID=A0A2M7WSE2_9BACT|nr:MAG: isoleucine--tRNA ligase [Candidatus Zambryskibacteria bacterium CG11_big_fil_rev_8_21_14_0_20_42_18]PJA32918.1 MAG: isoleucine--tRNA ligase [Candidatus Zambryskibacteria bacterium CG_4_9_14_3_um_filter_42_15]
MAEKSDRSEREEKILQFWKENKIFEKTLEKKSPKGDFIFYEGPPTANGRPAIHHLEARAFKDALPRYKTMRGFRVPRKAGWDTHGLPVELEVEKNLGLKSKKEIEQYGIAKFNKECRASVGKYISEWSKFTGRIGYWVNLDDAYFTYDNSYIETVWSILSHVEKRKLLYKDYKVVPWCPRCGTALSSHELAQGYKDVKDLSLYAKFKVVGEENTYFLAWTTTPWTLPGNVALAVGNDLDYVEIKVGEEILVLAKERLSIITEPYEIVAEHKGKEMVGMGYEPLYPFLNDKSDKSFKIYRADFVNTEEGTGIVHTAVMYGQDDFELGTKIGLPKYHLVDETGHFIAETDFLTGRFVRDEETAVEIIKDLAHRGLLFKKEKYEHSYPHCWRCKTPLIYYARDSWYIGMSQLRDKLVKENENINWEPKHIKEGRFGEWLREIKDWAISRERYWGTPLPIWQNADESKRLLVDSIDTLKKYTKSSGNKYFVMRHGGTEGNKKEIVSYKDEANDHLTGEGKEQVKKSAKKLKGKIDIIISSPFVRTRETAEIVAEITGLNSDDIIFDKRIQEINPGEYDGKSWPDYHDAMSKLGKNWFNASLGNSEPLSDCRKRVGESLYEIEEKYQGKNILFVTHGGPAWHFYINAGFFDPKNRTYSPSGKYVFVDDFKYFENAEIRELPFIPLPHNEDFEIDLHRPYIDEVVLEKDGEEYKRVKEVLDVWFDSGAMPFAQNPKNILYPADFISEAIDQTRGWFYTLHAIGVLMDKGAAYKNVICLGHLLDKEGKKMSKSIGNVVDPWEEIDKHGADALRFWMYSVNQPGESKNFDTFSVAEIARKVFNILDNIYAFYDLYRDRGLEKENFKLKNKHVLDEWILSKLNELIETSTSRLDDYQLLEPARAVREFLDNLSTWYLRRSRDRIKDGDKEAKQTLYFVLKEISKLVAPLTPLVAEDLYQKLRTDNDVESVHLEDWPEAQKINARIIENMVEVRKIVSIALEARSKANIKVRQPLSELKIRNNNLSEEFLGLIKEELNVKKVTIDKNLKEEVWLNTTLTPELEEEGLVREEIRAIQDMRKENGLKPSDVFKFKAPQGKEDFYDKHREEISLATNVELE